MRIWEGQQIPVGTILGYQIQWQSAAPRWETVDEAAFYRALHHGSALCFGRYIRAAIDNSVLTNEDGIVRFISDATGEGEGHD